MTVYRSNDGLRTAAGGHLADSCITHGYDCSACYSADETPKYFELECLTNITEYGDTLAVAGTKWTLEQVSATYPCQWLYQDAGYGVDEGTFKVGIRMNYSGHADIYILWFGTFGGAQEEWNVWNYASGTGVTCLDENTSYTDTSSESVQFYAV